MLERKSTISSLILALLGHRVSKKLRSTGPRGTLDRDLASLYSRLGSEDLKIDHFMPLVRAVVAEVPDIEVWKLVLQLITITTLTTPPPSLPSFCGTPRMSNSGSHDGFEETADRLEDGLREEFRDCSYIHVEGFFEKYFEGKRWSSQWKKVFEAIKSESVNNRWTRLPSPLIERVFWEWLSDIQEKHLKNARSRYCTTKSAKEMVNTSGKAQLDIFAKHPDYAKEMPHDWANVLVAGEHTSSKKDRKFLQMARYARNVFVAQPRRLFLPGFTIKDSKMEPYMFDRSGAYCASPFDIHENPERFIQVLVGYCWMSDKELGLDTFIERKRGREFISVSSETQSERMLLEIETKPIAWQRAAVGRGTSCYRTADQKAVVKFSWPSAQKYLSEPDLLRQADEKNVKGVVKLIGCQKLANISDLRSGMTFRRRRQVEGRDRMLEKTGSFSGSQFASISLADGSSREKKHKHDDEEESPPSKKPRSNSLASGLRKSFSAKDLEDGEDSQASKYKQSKHGGGFVDRVLSCLALKPAGKHLSKFDDIPELLCAFRDAIKAHRSLLLDGRILHRDISSNNIIITDPEEADGYHGVLIDMDLATTVDDEFRNNRTNSQRMTGTLKYMAIEVLEVAFRDKKFTLEHTYRHDLESFFYVFLSICASHSRTFKNPDPFHKWYSGTYEDMAASKAGRLERSNFEPLVLNKFAPELESLKALAWTMRDALFSKGVLQKGTPQAQPSVLYDKIIEAFDEALDQL